MKFTCGVEKLKTAIATADRITGKNLALSVLGTVLLVASDKKIKIRATNLSVGIELTVSADVEHEGVLALRGDILANYLSSLRDGEEIVCELSGDMLVVRAKKSRVSIKTFPYEDFPNIPIVTGTKITIPPKAFIEGVGAVVYAAAVTDIKPEIASVYIYSEEDMLVFVATDSFRLAEKKIKIKNLPAITPFLIPSKNITEIVRVLGDLEGDIVLEYSENQVAFSHRNVYVTSRVVNGIFPDYKQIIPKGATTEAVVLKQDLLASLKMANIFSGKLNQVSLDISPKEKKFISHITNSDLGDESSSLDAAISGEEVALSVNLRYFTDCFQSMASDSVVVAINGPQKPMIVRGVDDRSFFYLIMPMNK